MKVAPHSREIGVQSSIPFDNASTFRLCAAAGLFRDSDNCKRVYRMKRASMLLGLTIVVTQLAVLVVILIHSGFASVLDMTFRIHALISMTLVLLVLYPHFDSMTDTQYGMVFCSSSRNRLDGKYICAWVIYFFVIVVKDSMLITLMWITNSSTDYFRLITFLSFSLQSLLEVIMFLVIGQMYNSLIIVSSYMEQCLYGDDIILPKLERLTEGLELCTSINRFYGRQVLFIFSFMFLQLIICAYYAVMFSIQGMNSTYQKVVFVLDVSVIVQSFTPVLLAASACNKVYSMVDAVYDHIIRKTLLQDSLTINKKLCLYLTLRRTVVFNACGYFHLDYEVVTSIITAGTTYLVILIQFSLV